MKRKITSLAMIALICLAPLTQTACDWKKAERPLTAIGYNAQTGLLAAGRAVKEIAGCKGVPVSAPLLASIKTTSRVIEDWSKKIDQTVEINPQTKVELIALTDSVIAQIGQTVALLKPGDSQLQDRLLVVRALLSSARVTIATISVTRPTAGIKVDVKEAGAHAARAGAKSTEQNICVIDKLGVIASQFAGDILVQKGLDAAALQNLRVQQFKNVQEL